MWSWWRHRKGIFSALLALCAGNSPVTGEFPMQRPATQSLDVFFDLRLKKRLTKQSWGWWFETPYRSLWRHCNGLFVNMTAKNKLPEIAVRIPKISSQESHSIMSKLQCGAVITRTIFFKIITKVTPHLGLAGELWGVFCGFKLSFMFWPTHGSDVWYILFYWMAL